MVFIENERDEDLGDGALPQLSAGHVVVVDLNGVIEDVIKLPEAQNDALLRLGLRTSQRISSDESQLIIPGDILTKTVWC